jgi:hypothetical protein
MPSPVDYPKLTIGGKEYTLRLTLGGAMRLEREGVQIDTLKGAKFDVTLVCKLLSALLGTDGTNGEFVPCGKTAEQIGDMIPAQEFGAFAVAIQSALKKAPPAAPETAEGEPALQAQ